MMMVMMLFLFYLRKVDDGTFHRIEYFLTTQYFNRCGNNVLPDSVRGAFYSCLYFFGIGFIGTAQDDGSCALYLILEEFAEVSEMHFAFITSTTVVAEFRATPAFSTPSTALMTSESLHLRRTALMMMRSG